MTGRVREEIIDRLGLDPTAERLDLGQSNHTWIGPDYILRLSAVPGGRTLVREAAVVRCLPESVGYPVVLGDGIVAGFDWMVTARLPGDNLGRRWPDLTSEERAAAVADLRQRLERVHDTDLGRLPRLPWTPLYAFDRDVRSAQLAAAAAVLGPVTVEVLERLIERGLERAAGEPRVLVHTDAGPHNAVWDGQRAVPIDFEFCCVGPADLDLEHLASEIMRSADSRLIEEFRRSIVPRLAEPGAIDRLRCYAILYELWALTKWIANDPESTEKATWQPALDLRAHTDAGDWIDRLAD
jgi:aminoglycoside phosphotransferase (APT) family kinase protein